MNTSRVTKAFVVRDSLGRYWIGQNESVRVYDSGGKYLATVGRLGAGPGEFRRPAPVYTDASGNVHVVDRALARETVVLPDLTPQSVEPLATPSLQRIAPLERGAYVVNAWFHTELTSGHPLHIVRGAAVVRSFGMSFEEGPQDEFTSIRIIAVDRFQRIFSARPYDYKIEVWADTGLRIVAFSGPQLNESSINREPNASTGPRLLNEIVALYVDQADQLWVLLQQPRPGWRKYLSSRRSTSAERHAARRGPPPQPDSLFSARLDVIDLSTGIIVARRDGLPPFTPFAGDHMLVQQILMVDGSVTNAIWQAELKLRTARSGSVSPR